MAIVRRDLGKVVGPPGPVPENALLNGKTDYERLEIGAVTENHRLWIGASGIDGTSDSEIMLLLEDLNDDDVISTITINKSSIELLKMNNTNNKYSSVTVEEDRVEAEVDDGNGTTGVLEQTKTDIKFNGESLTRNVYVGYYKSDGGYELTDGTTYDDILNAYNDGKPIIMQGVEGGRTYIFDLFNAGTFYFFSVQFQSSSGGVKYTRVHRMSVNSSSIVSTAYKDIVPVPPASGTYTLQAINGVIQWV